MRSISRDIVGAFIFSNDGYLLLGKSYKGGVYQGSWIVPGGGIEPGETNDQALKREVLEETGIDISAQKIEKMNIDLKGQSQKTLRETGETVLVNMIFHNFLVTMDKSSRDIEASSEDDFTNPTWHRQTELSDLELSDPTKETLAKLGLI